MDDRDLALASTGAPARQQAHRYANSRPFSVFALAAVAAGGILGVTWGAHTALIQATIEQKIAAPPDLRKVVERVAESAESVINRRPAA